MIMMMLIIHNNAKRKVCFGCRLSHTTVKFETLITKKAFVGLKELWILYWTAKLSLLFLAEFEICLRPY